MCLSCVACFATAKSSIVSYKWEPLWHVVFILTIHFGMNKHFLFQSYMYCSHALHIFSNYIVNTSIELHKITLQGKQHKNQAKVHASHIAKWAAHATIADAPPFHGEMSYNDEYMVWFRPRTIRHITKETSYWDTLISLQRLFCYKCTLLRIVQFNLLTLLLYICDRLNRS